MPWLNRSDVDDCARIGTEVATALAEACLTHAHNRVASRSIDSAAPWCWFLFGAAARGELLDTRVPSHRRRLRRLRRRLSASNPASTSMQWPKQLLTWLRECGLTSPGSQPLNGRCRTNRSPNGSTLSARQFGIRSATIYMFAANCSIWRHSREKYRYWTAMRDEIRASAARPVVLIALLANDTLANLPPLTFFRGLVAGTGWGTAGQR